MFMFVILGLGNRMHGHCSLYISIFKKTLPNKITIVEMSVLPNLIYRVNVIPIKIPHYL